jgi:hypothetical protein
MTKKNYKIPEHVHSSKDKDKLIAQIENMVSKREKEEQTIKELFYLQKMLGLMQEHVQEHLSKEFNIFKNGHGAWIDGLHAQCVDAGKGDTYTGPGSLWNKRKKKWEYNFNSNSKDIKMSLDDIKVVALTSTNEQIRTIAKYLIEDKKVV